MAGAPKFCPPHAEVFARVAKELRQAKDKPYRVIGPDVKISYVPAKGTPKSPPKGNIRADFQTAILEALAAGPLASIDLATAAETQVKNGSFVRARKVLLDAGKIRVVGKSGRSLTYALAGTP